MYHYVQDASSGLRLPAGNPTHGHPTPGNSAGELTTLWVLLLGRRSSDFHLAGSRMSPNFRPRLHRGFISEVHHGRRPCDHRLPISRRAPGGAIRTKGFRMPALISRKPQRALAVAALVVMAVLAGGIWLVQSGQSAAAPDVSIVKASRGDVVVSVGGVGRIVTGGGASVIELPASGGTTTQRLGGRRARARRRRTPSSRTWPGTWIACSSRRGSTSRRGSRSRDSTMTGSWPRQSSRRGSISRRLASSSARSCTTTRRRVILRRPPRSPRRARPSAPPARTWLRRPAGRTPPT